MLQAEIVYATETAKQVLNLDAHKLWKRVQDAPTVQELGLAGAAEDEDAEKVDPNEAPSEANDAEQTEKQGKTGQVGRPICRITFLRKLQDCHTQTVVRVIGGGSGRLSAKRPG